MVSTPLISVTIVEVIVVCALKLLDDVVEVGDEVVESVESVEVED